MVVVTACPQHVVVVPFVGCVNEPLGSLTARWEVVGMWVQSACISIVVLLSPSSSLSLRLMMRVQLHAHCHCGVVVVASPSFPRCGHAMPWVRLCMHRRQWCPRCPLIMVANVAALTRCHRCFRHASRTALASTSWQGGGGGGIVIAHVATC